MVIIYMNSFDKIVNPATGKKVNINGKLGKKILENYFNQKWEECLKEIKTAKTLCNNLMSEYYDIMTLRINEFKENPLPNDWDGVYIATSK